LNLQVRIGVVAAKGSIAENRVRFGVFVIGDVVANENGAAHRRGSRRKGPTALAVALIVVSLFSWALYEFYLEEHWIDKFDPYVVYRYTLSISSNSSEEYTVFCPFISDSDGVICSEALSHLHFSFDSDVSIVSTERGDALEVVGSGVTLVSLDVYSELPGLWERFKEFSSLSLTEQPWHSGNASFHSSSEWLIVGLVFDFHHVYGSLGADFLRFEIEGTLQESGWSKLPLDFSHAVS
jgi:hypothetical protein